MFDFPTEDLLPQERAAFATHLLYSGQPLKTVELAERLGLTRQGAWRLLTKIAHVVPIYQDKEGYWLLLSRTRYCGEQNAP